MAKLRVLVTAPRLVGAAEKILCDAGAEIVDMPQPATEETLTARCERQALDAMILRDSPPVTRAVLAAAKQLKVISKAGAGCDSVDLDAATELGIAMMVANGANADAVAEHTLALMLSMARDVPQFDRKLRSGVWKDPAAVGKGFRGQVVGIYGYGQIGRKIAALAQACGAQVMLHSRSAIKSAPTGMDVEESFERFLGSVDILSLHCRLTPETRGVIGERQIGLMKTGAYIVNTARGALIDEPALVAALKSGKLAGAGLDVFVMEPTNAENPLFAMPSVVVTPHVASQTRDARNSVDTMAADNVVSYLRGEIRDVSCVMNPAVLERGSTNRRAEVF